MADNVTLPLTGSGDATAVAATDDVGGVHYPIAKLASGTLGDTALIGGDATNGLDVDVTRLPALPAGTNNIGDVDVLSVPAPLSTTGGGTEAAALRVTIASDSTGVVSVDDNGGSLTVDVGTALPAGTNAIGKLAANSGVDIGDVDVTSIVPGTGATNLGKAEDAVHASGDVGVMLLAVRRDSPTPAAADGDYVALSVSSGGRVFADVDGNLTAVSVVEEAFVHGFALHGDAADSMPVLAGHEARTTNPTAVDNGDTVRSMADDVGRQVVVPFGVRDLVAHQHTQIASSSSETTIATAGGAGVYHDLISLILTNQTATAVNVTIKDSTGGTTRMVIALAASGGAVLMFPAPVASSATNANWTATLSSAAVTVNIFAQFVKNV